jgi:6-phosphogluconolactonase (cycloisomerase 2 family)
MHSLWSRTVLALAIATLLVSTGCTGYSNASSANSSMAPANTYAYVSEENSSTFGFSVAQFQVSSGGTFTALNPPSVTINASDYSLTTDPSGKYLFTDGSENDLTPGAILQFVIGTDGTLADNSVPTVGTANLPGALAFTPDGRFAITPNGDNTVSSYALSSTGSLSLINTVLAGFGPNSAVIDSTGQFAYVTAGGLGNTSEFTISEYTISPSGALNLAVTYPLWPNPGAMTVSPRGFLYLTEYTPPDYGTNPGAIVEFSINETNGGLSVVNTYSTADSDPGRIIFDPTGAYAYVTNVYSLTISQYSVDASTGALTPNGPDTPVGIGSISGVVDPSGKFLYLANQGQEDTRSPQVSLFVINADDTLSPDGIAASLATDSYPFAIAIAQQ